MSHLTLLTAGNGGIRFLAGLIEVRPEEEIHVIANVGNDCEIWGLYCCPDIDLLLHALAGVTDPFSGRADGESFNCFDTIRKLGMPSWYRISDREIAAHLVRSELLRSGVSLSGATDQLAERFGLGVRLLPASNDPVRTRVETEEGIMSGLQYAARRQERLELQGVRYEGADVARPAPGVVESIEGADRVILAPADPALGLGPILAVADIRKALSRTRAGVVAISPIVGSQPARGNGSRSAAASASTSPPLVRFAQGFRGLIDILVLHTTDVPMLEAVRSAGIDAWVDNTLINSREDARRLAGRVAFAERNVARMR